MKTHVWAKIFGWSQFALQLLPTISNTFATAGTPHGAINWIGFIGSLGSAIAIHAASNTDGSK